MRDYAVVLGQAIARLVNRAEQFWCRHDYIPANDKGRLFLRCSKCQAETPGWDLADALGPRKLSDGNPDHFRMR